MCRVARRTKNKNVAVAARHAYPWEIPCGSTVLSTVGYMVRSLEGYSRNPLESVWPVKRRLLLIGVPEMRVWPSPHRVPFSDTADLCEAVLLISKSEQ